MKRRLIHWIRKIGLVLLDFVQSLPFIIVLLFLAIFVVIGVLWSFLLFAEIFVYPESGLKATLTGIDKASTQLGQLTIGVAGFTALILQYSSVCSKKVASRLNNAGKNSLISTCYLASAFLMDNVASIESMMGVVLCLNFLAISLALFYFALSFFQLIRVLFSRSL